MDYFKLIDFLIRNWFWFALFSSSFWGIRAMFYFSGIIESQTPYFEKIIEKQKPYFTVMKKWGKARYIMYTAIKNMVYQFSFNFIGSFAGWFCFYALLYRIQNYNPKLTGFTAGDIVLFFVSFIGLTGHLPQSTYGVVTSIGEIGKLAALKSVELIGKN